MILDKVPDAIIACAPLAGVILFALPSYYGLLKQRKFIGLLIIVVLGLYALFVETLAVKTGAPFGTYSYTDILGIKLLDTTPLAVAFVYPPILLVTFWFASKFTRNLGRVFITALLSALFYAILSPATVKLELLEWEAGGGFYGAPWLSLVGWLAVGLVGGLIVHGLWGKEQRVKAPVAYSGLAVLLFWTGVNAGVSQHIPLGIGALYSLLVIGIIVLEKQQFKDAPD